MIQRYDARLAADVCGNKDVIMRESHDGLFVRHEDHERIVRELRAEVKRLKEDLEAANDYAEALKQEPIDLHDFKSKLWNAFGKPKCRSFRLLRHAEGLVRELATLRAEVARLSAPVSDEEWKKAYIHFHNGEKTDRAHVNALIAARRTPKP